MNTDFSPQTKAIIGWREWVSLPDLGIPFVKVKVDTGAKTSSLHALNIQPFDRDGVPWVRFDVAPRQLNDELIVRCESPFHDHRLVRSSSGDASRRYVIQSTVRWKSQLWLIDITLADRTRMAFRMLLGRQALSDRVVVASDQSFCGGRPRRKRKL